MFGPKVNPKLEGKVHGVVVQARRKTSEDFILESPHAFSETSLKFS